jgi:hypothetical protein
MAYLCRVNEQDDSLVSRPVHLLYALSAEDGAYYCSHAAGDCVAFPWNGGLGTDISLPRLLPPLLAQRQLPPCQLVSPPLFG